MPEISVIVPVYNCEKYLEKCINSILSQTFDDLELILINDGSSDNSGKVCDYFKETDSRIKVIHQKNMGVSVARNVGLDISNGKYIGFIDGDDYIESDMYEFLYNNIKKNEAEVAICGIENIFIKNDGSEKLIHQTSDFSGVKVLNGEEAFSESLKSKIFSVNPVNKLFDKKLFDGKRFPEGKISEDAFLIPKVLSKASKVVCSSDIKYYYVRHENSITTSSFFEKDWNVTEAYFNHLNTVKKHYPKLIKEAEFRYFWSYTYVLDKMIVSKNKVNKSDYDKAIKFIKKNILKIIFNPYFSLKRKIVSCVLMINENLYKKLIIKVNKN